LRLRWWWAHEAAGVAPEAVEVMPKATPETFGGASETVSERLRRWECGRAGVQVGLDPGADCCSE
jgi:hypothetical protein